MIDEVIRTYAAFLADPVTGVNALRASVPREVAEAAPPAVTIVDEKIVAWAARELIPAEKLTTDCTLILSHGVFGNGDDARSSLFIERSRPSPHVPLLLRIARKGVDTKSVLHQSRQILRCVKRAIAVHYDRPATSRTPALHQVNIDPPGELVEPGPYVQPDGDLVVLPLLIAVPALDTWALNITN
jgi:hypothetical protein